MCSYLHRAPNGRYYFRMGIPANLRPFFDGKREIKQALNTADRETAKGLIPDFTSAARLSLNEARIALGVPASSRSGEPAPAVPKRPRTRREALADWDRDQVEFSEGPGSLEPEEWQEWVRQNTGKGQYLDTDILDGWAAEAKPGAKGKAAYASSAKLFYSTMGRKSVELVSKADVMAYKNKLIAEGRSQTNVRDHLAYIRTLFKWAAQNDHIAANPAQDVRMAVKAKAEKRQDFNIDDLNALFAGPVHAEGHRPKDVRAGGEAAYWMPLLALFMGARREEIGQLRVSDVQQAPYIDAEEERQEVWCIDITDATDDAEGLANQLKNAGSRRLIPLHPKLIELGFIDYVQSLPDQRGRVFPVLTPSGIGQKLTDKWGQWFTQYKRKCGITDKAKVFHSFRHTWKTHAVDAGIAERICRQFQGHEGKDAADKYGSAPSMRVLVEAIASYRVPGLVIPIP